MTSSGESGATFARTSLRDTVSETAAQIESIIDSAEQVAIQIQNEARSEADVYLEARRAEADDLIAAQRTQLESITRALVDRAHALQRDAEALAGELDRTLQALSAPPGHRGSPEGRSPMPRMPAAPSGEASHGPAPARREAEPAQPEPVTVSKPNDRTRQEALLRVTQMAVAQSSREDIEATVRDEFRIQDAGSLVDEILGPKAPAESPS